MLKERNNTISSTDAKKTTEKIEYLLSDKFYSILRIKYFLMLD